MRIPCAKCGYIHDSTVTPFLHDVVRENNVPLVTITYGKYNMSEFKCEKCGATNSLTLVWWSKEEANNAPENTDQVS